MKAVIQHTLAVSKVNVRVEKRYWSVQVSCCVADEARGGEVVCVSRVKVSCCVAVEQEAVDCCIAVEQEARRLLRCNARGS